VVSLHDADEPVVVEAVLREERVRLDDLDGLPARIRQWEEAERPSPRTDPGGEHPC
jgi:hypothetical protein